MSGNSNFPTGLDDDASLIDVVDGTTAVTASHHNNLKEAIKALETKLGIHNTGSASSVDYRLGHPTDSHRHDGASGQGRTINPSIFGGFPQARQVVPWFYQGSIPSGASLGAPFAIGKTLSIENVSVQVRRAPSGATLAFDINFGATSLWFASQGNRPILVAGTNAYGNASPNLVTYASGTPIVIDADTVGTSEPGTDLSIMFVFRE